VHLLPTAPLSPSPAPCSGLHYWLWLIWAARIGCCGTEQWYLSPHTDSGSGPHVRRTARLPAPACGGSHHPGGVAGSHDGPSRPAAAGDTARGGDGRAGGVAVGCAAAQLPRHPLGGRPGAHAGTSAALEARLVALATLRGCTTFLLIHLTTSVPALPWAIVLTSLSNRTDPGSSAHAQLPACIPAAAGGGACGAGGFARGARPPGGASCRGRRHAAAARARLAGAAAGGRAACGRRRHPGAHARPPRAPQAILPPNQT